MKKLRALFYYTTSGIAIGYLLSLLLFFSVNLEMMVGISMVMYVFLGFGIMLGLAFSEIKLKYMFFVIEILAVVLAAVTGRLVNFLYITKETLNIMTPASKIMVPLLIFVVVVNVINIYIVLTLSKYQKVYTKEELRALRKEEVKLSELRDEKTDVERERIKKSRKKLRIVVLVLIAAFLAVYFFVPSVNSGINNAVAVISKLDTKVVIEYLRSYGKLAAVVSFCLMILQSIAAPIPAFLITLSNAAIFGWIYGAILSWSSAMVGASLCYFIARVLGRDIVEKLTGRGALESVDVFFERYGKYTILICRLLPFVSFDIVSYAAGLTNMGFWSFFIATGIGQLPATLVYSYVGGTLSGGAQKLFIGLLTLFALSILIGIIKKVYDDKHKARKKSPENSGEIEMKIKK